MIQKKSKKIF